MTTPSPIGRGEHCTCQRDHTGELLPTGCPEHSIENFAQRHRFGKQWRDLDGNRVDPVCPQWVEWVVIGTGLAGLAWFVARPALLLAWVVWGSK